MQYEFLPKPKGIFNIKKESIDNINVPWHVHSEYELTYIGMVSGSEHVGSHFGVIDSDEVLLIGPYLPHNWQKTRNGAVSVPHFGDDYQICIHFSSDLFGKEFFKLPPFHEISELLNKAQYGLSFKGEGICAVKEMMNRILNSDEFNKCLGLVNLLKYLSGFRSPESLSVYGFKDDDNPEKVQRMERVIQYITDNCSGDIPIQFLADIAKMTPQAFCSYFRKRTGKAPKAFINEMRIANACMMLHNESTSITKICFNAGFNTLSSFNRQFKKVTGVTPQAFRKNLLLET
ncbi:MAG: AraC family transcriptional regulator [Candidatus Cryptobacteroides sp.]